LFVDPRLLRSQAPHVRFRRSDLANCLSRRETLLQQAVVAQETQTAVRDLRDWLKRVRAIGELQEVAGADWNLELGIISELNAKCTESKALLFDEIKRLPEGLPPH
jgi:hypothetical protein